MPAVGDEFEWVIQTTNDGGISWENSYTNMGRPSDCLEPDKVFHYLVKLIGENKHMFNQLDDSIRYGILRTQTNTIYCQYSVRYLIDCFEVFNIPSEKEPFEIET